MEAIILNLEENTTLTPEESLAAFTCTYTPFQVQIKLWHLFYLAVKGGIEEPGSPITPEETALLIDQLINLVTAVSILHQESRANQNNQQEGSRHE